MDEALWALKTAPGLVLSPNPLPKIHGIEAINKNRHISSSSPTVWFQEDPWDQLEKPLWSWDEFQGLFFGVNNLIYRL